MQDFLTHVLASVTGAAFFNFVLVPLIMSTALGGIIAVAFGRLKQRKEQLAFGVGSFVLFLALVYAVGTRPLAPALSGSIQTALSGNMPNDRDTIVIFTINVINAGTMQTIVKNWKVSAKANNRSYNAVFPTMPDNFIFNNIPQTVPNQPTSITFHKTDSILEKSLTPIQIGSILPGILFVAFQNVDPAIFRTGVDYTVTFEDVFSRLYSMEISSTGSFGAVATSPGIKTEVTCPIPPGGLPKLGNDVTNQLKSPSAQ